MASTVSGISTELLDDPAADPGTVRRSLRHIARSNRWFGGASALRWALARLTRGIPPGTALTLLDVGTGAGDLPRAAQRWAARRGLRIVPLGVDVNRAAAALARDSGVRTAVASAAALPVAPQGVDLVLVSQVAHHFTPDAVVSLMRCADRIARVGVIVLDLRRSPVAAVAFRIGAALLRFDAVTTHDGLVSIRRGYTARELAALVRRAGARATVSRRPGWRLCAIWRPAARPPGEAGC